MNLELHIKNFDGPMDLLLHLVKETKLDIYEINMLEIIESYLNYINSMKTLNIDIGGEFLLMASSLIHLKSKMLIGKTSEEEVSDDEYNIVSEEDLKQKIIDYEKYKNITKELQSLEEKRSEIYTKLPENLKSYMEDAPLINEGVTTEDLLNSLINVQKRLHYKEPLETRITKSEVSVTSRVKMIRSVLMVRKKCFFEELFDVPSKDYIIATFLAILEMSKASEIKLFQNSNFGNIELELV